MPETRERFERMMAVVPVALYEYTREAGGAERFLYLSPHIKEIFEREPDDFVRDSGAMWQAIHPDDVNRLRETNDAATREGTPFACDVRIVTPSGKVKWLGFRSRPCPVRPGQPPIWVGFIADISERKRAAESLRKSEERWQFALEGAGDGVWEWSAAGGVYFSPRWKALLGYADDEIANDHEEWESRLHADDRERVLAALDAQFAGSSERYEIEYRMRAKDGSYKWVLARGKVLGRTPDGRAERVIGTHTDISQRKAYELEIEKLSRVYAALSQVNQAIVRATSASEMLQDAVRALVEHGRFRMAWVGRLNRETLRVEPQARFGTGSDYVSRIQVYADLRAEGKGPAGTSVREGRAEVFNDFLGEPRSEPWQVEATAAGLHACAAFPIRMAGEVWGTLVVYSDERGFFGPRETELLTEAALDISFALENLENEARRRTAVQALGESEAYLKLALDAAELGSWRSDGTGKLHLDARCQAHHGLSKADITLDELYARIHPADAGPVRKITEEGFERDGHSAVEHRIVRADGSTGWLAVRANCYYEGEGAERRIALVIGTTQDITARKRAEEERASLEAQLLQSQKLESIGRLAGGVAHDFNNLLTIINGYSDLLLAQLDPDNPQTEPVREIRKAGERATSLTRHLLAFSRKQIVEKKPIAVNSMLSDSLDTLRRLVGEDVQLVTDMCPEPDVVLADAGQLHQVLLNLVVNARDAMPQGGRLHISTRRVELDAASAARLPEAQPGPYVVLSIADTGVGMTREVQAKVFEPFFTTKGEGKGTGLGLSTVYGIVRHGGGWITLESHPGQGSRFHIGLPTAADEARPEMETDRGEEDPRGSETVLLVEDQQEVRKLAAAVLRRFGYRVLDAGSAHAALELAATLSEPINLLLTDVVMPNMTGRELAARLRKTRPDVKVLFMSGHAGAAIGRDEPPGADVQLIAKPFGPEELAARVRAVLGERSWTATAE